MRNGGDDFDRETMIRGMRWSNGQMDWINVTRERLSKDD